MKTVRLVFWLSVLLALPCSAGWPAPGMARLDERLQAVLATASVGEAIPVIFHLAEHAGLQGVGDLPRRERRAHLISRLRAVADRSQQGLRAELQARGVVRHQAFWVTNAVAATVPAGMLPALAARAELASVVLDATIPLLPQPVATTPPVEANIALVGAPDLWTRGINGQGAVVATVDSGADLLHADLGVRWRGGSNSWYDPNGQHPDAPFDHYGHGTGVLGVLVGGSATGGAIGVAPGAKWIATKIYNDDGEASYSVIYAAFQWLLDPDGDPSTDDAPDIVNNSWMLNCTVNVCYPLSAEFLELLQLFRAADIAMVFAAGNTGPGAATSVSPANYPGAFVTGSVGTALAQTEVSSFSARGPSACDGAGYPDVVAPGYAIRTAGLTLRGSNPTATQVGSGTSYAAPAVAGIMALLRGVFPEVTVTALENVLQHSAHDVAQPGVDNAGGYGLISAPRAFAALNLLPGVIGTFAGGAWYLDANGNNRWDGPAAGDRIVRFGSGLQTPVVGDWNGNGTLDVGTYAAGTWYLDANGNNRWDGPAAGDRIVRFGSAEARPVVGDWDGDGTSEVGTFREGVWYLDANGNGRWDGTAEGGDKLLHFGGAAAQPVVGDWNGDGVSDVGTFGLKWYLDANGNGRWDGVDGGDQVERFGAETMLPVTGDWNDDGILDIGTYKAGRWYLDANGNRMWDAGDLTVKFGTDAMRPVTSR